MRAVVFGSSSTKEHEEDYKNAIEVGKLLAQKGYDVVNGGYIGTMAAVSKGAREAGGKVIGITCEKLNYAPPNKYLSEVIHTKDIFERLEMSFKDSDLFVVLPGGSGTITEMMLACDLMGQKVIKKKPIIVFDYWEPIVNILMKKQNVLEGMNNIIFIKDLNELKGVLRHS